eukprot:m.10554 g.10554  ORF g.10554 m.10554 type:complete len:67 (+) comp4279_c0_seq1:198-398(+)
MASSDIVRLADPAQDAERIAAIYGFFVETTPSSFEIDPPSKTEMETRINACIERGSDYFTKWVKLT